MERILSDRQAREALDLITANIPEADKLLDIAKKTADKYSYVDHQTYPRPGHPKPEKRLSPLFTLASVITSLRCTLEIESQVTDELIVRTKGLDDNLVNISIGELESVLYSAGMATQKSRWIFDNVHILDNDPNYTIDNLKNNDIEKTRQKLLKLKGIGQKAVDCFMLLGLERPVFPVDVNVFRIVSRNFPNIFEDKTEPKFTNPKQVRSVKNFLERAFNEDVTNYQILHTYLLLAEKHKIDS